jgi:hypothetical protein
MHGMDNFKTLEFVLLTVTYCLVKSMNKYLDRLLQEARL